MAARDTGLEPKSTPTQVGTVKEKVGASQSFHTERENSQDHSTNKAECTGAPENRCPCCSGVAPSANDVLAVVNASTIPGHLKAAIVALIGTAKQNLP